MGRTLVGVEAWPGAALWRVLEAALDGTGPALLPLPTDAAEAARVLAALRPTEPVEHDDVAVVVPTSGSTGEPKGALLTAAALHASAAATHARLGGPGRWLLAIPPSHVGGLQVAVRALLAGAEPQTMPDGPFTAEAFVAAAAAGAAATGARRYTSLVPTQLARLLADPAATDALAGFDGVLLGGAATPEPLLARAREVGVTALTTYGMSETSGGCVYDGRALDGVTVTLDVDGRVLLTGPVVARGYRLQPALTAEAFRREPDGAATFVTGDLGRLLPDGALQVLGRVDDMVVTGGEKVAPAAVETALASHPSVAEVVVVGVPDAEWGAAVRACVVLRPGTTLALEAAREHVAGALGRRSAPRELVVLEALPLLPSGKPDRAALRC